MLQINFVVIFIDLKYTMYFSSLLTWKCVKTGGKIGVLLIDYFVMEAHENFV